MSGSALVHAAELESLTALDANSWREEISRRLRDGMRAITLFGRPSGAQALLTCVLADPQYRLQILRTEIDPSHGYHELTTAFPSLQAFEREMHEQLGLRIAGHPWLKPIRYEGGGQGTMGAYPFYKIDGKEVHEVAVGPIHAGVIEPGAFRFMCEGEKVHHLEIQLGYQHRGAEKKLLQGDPKRLGPLVETIAGDSSVAHAWAYCAAIEELAGAEVEAGADIFRAIALELERVAMHLAGLAGLATDLGFLQGASTYGRLRTIAINSMALLCGSRFGRSAVRPGGAGAAMPPDMATELSGNLGMLQRDAAIINDRFASSLTSQRRLQGTGILSRNAAAEMGLVGMIARASGIRMDARQAALRGVYKEIPMGSPDFQAGDCQARAQIRIGEIDASLDWLQRVLARFPELHPTSTTLGPFSPNRFAISLVEGWRGEVVHCLETGGAGEIIHYKVQDPSFRNWFGLAIAVRGNAISDFPICNKSFDLSYCGNDL
jgi:Ni,Fe-hydrogenase III large subunit